MCRDAAASRLAWAARIEEINALEGDVERRSKEATRAKDRLEQQLDRLKAKLTRLEEAVKRAEPSQEEVPAAEAEQAPVLDEQMETAASIDEELAATTEEEEEEEESAEDLAQRVASQWIPAANRDGEQAADSHEYAGDETYVEDDGSGDEDEDAIELETPSPPPQSEEGDAGSQDDVADIEVGFLGEGE